MNWFGNSLAMPNIKAIFCKMAFIHLTIEEHIQLNLYTQAPAIPVRTFYKLVGIIEIGDLHIRAIP